MGGALKANDPFAFALAGQQIDLVVTVEAPSDDCVAKFALALGNLGNVRTTTLKAFTEPEYQDIIQSLP